MKTDLFPPIDLVVVDAALACNFNCAYCYAEAQIEQHRMHPFVSVAHVRRLLEELSELRTRGFLAAPRFVWPGGEPLLAGVDFFRSVVSLQNEYFPNDQVCNQINSNASLLDSEWIAFFEEQGFDLIVGLDGPRDVNHNRRSRTGTDVYDDIMRGVALIQDSTLPLRYISVVTPSVSERAEYLYRFAIELAPETVDYIPCFDAANLPDIGNRAYANFMTSMFDLWYDDKSDSRPRRITTLTSIIEATIQGETTCCTFMRNCGGRIYMNASGMVRYCCNGYFSSDFSRLGQIDTLSLMDLFEREDSVLGIIRRHVIELQDRCSPCPLFSICGGGCTTQRPSDGERPVGLTHYCRARYAIIRHILRSLEAAGVALLPRAICDWRELPEAPPQVDFPIAGSAAREEDRLARL